MAKTFENVKVGDKVVCFDEYSHDYEEHTLLITSVEISEGQLPGYECPGLWGYRALARRNHKIAAQ